MNHQENHILSSIEKHTNELRELSEDKIFSAKKAIQYTLLLNQKSTLASTEVKSSLAHGFFVLSNIIATLSAIFLFCISAMSIILYLSDTPIHWDRISNMLINSSILIFVCVIISYFLNRVKQHFEKQIVQTTEEFFENKFTTLSKAEIHFVNNIMVDARDWQNHKFWHPMNMSEFREWSKDIADKI